MPASHTVVDLFAGAGGISHGFASRGWTPLAAVEKSAMAATTWAINHLPAPPLSDWKTAYAHAAKPIVEQLDSGLCLAGVDDVAGDPEALQWLSDAAPTAIAGGPPCKGFSTNGRRDPADPRNLLVWSMLDVIDAVRPPLVVIENVLGMTRRLKGQTTSTFDAAAGRLASIGYHVQPCEVDAAHFDVPQHRRRVLLLGVRAAKGHVAPLWRTADPTTLFGPPLLAPRPTSPTRPLTVGEALADLDDGGYVGGPEHTTYRSPAGQWRAALRDGATAPPNHSLPNHTPKVVDRYRLYHAMHQAGVPAKLLSDAAIAKDPSRLVPCNGIADPGITRAGETMAEAAWRLRTRKRTQRVLAGDLPAPTIGTLAEDWVHPTKPRTVTPREYARLQAFPDTFVFSGRDQTGGLRRRVETPTYSQIGNSVPPPLAAAVADAFAHALGGTHQQAARTVT